MPPTVRPRKVDGLAQHYTARNLAIWDQSPQSPLLCDALLPIYGVIEEGSAQVGPPSVIPRGRHRGPHFALSTPSAGGHMVRFTAGLSQPPREALSLQGGQDGQGDVRSTLAPPSPPMPPAPLPQGCPGPSPLPFPDRLCRLLGRSGRRVEGCGQQPEHSLP